jgi:hypothetical protein
MQKEGVDAFWVKSPTDNRFFPDANICDKFYKENSANKSAGG